jgi:hypothetical protein
MKLSPLATPEEAVYLRATRLLAVRQAVTGVFGGAPKVELTDPAELQRVVKLTRAAISAVSGAYGTIVGGLAVQELGYTRWTEDVDIVLDAAHYSQVLDILRKNGFAIHDDLTLRNAASEANLDILKEGQLLKNSRLPVPHPAELGPNGGFATLAGLARMKLDTARAKDFADLVELCKPRLAQSDALRAALPEVLRPDFDRVTLQARKELQA